MKNLICLFIAVLIIGCEKEDSSGKVNVSYPDYIRSGDTVNTTFLKLDYKLINYTKSDSFPSSNVYGENGSEFIPLKIDKDDIFDIRYGYTYLKERDFLIAKTFFMSNNYGNEKNIEFAVQKEDYYGASADSTHPVIIKLLTTFNKFDTINKNQRWVKDPEVKDVYYISYYYNFQKYFENYSGKDLFYNGNVLNKYIAIRRKVDDQYIYGWIEFSVANYERLEIHGCAFADK